MSEYREVDISIEEAVRRTGKPYPSLGPYDDISLLVVAWNEAKRIGPLLEYLKPYFDQSVICVQDSTDDTLEIVSSIMDLETDQILTDRHWGHGDASFPKMVKATRTRWAFVVSCDEWPTTELMDSLGLAAAVAQLDPMTSEAVWFRFRAWIDDLEASEGSHLRLFKSHIGWPRSLHSRPMTRRAIGWPHGWFEHRRSLDEMMRDYLSYQRVAKGNPGHDRHNREMMRGACTFVAERKGWDKVIAYEWWDEVRAQAFAAEETPWQT